MSSKTLGFSDKGFATWFELGEAFLFCTFTTPCHRSKAVARITQFIKFKNII